MLESGEAGRLTWEELQERFVGRRAQRSGCAFASSTHDLVDLDLRDALPAAQGLTYEQIGERQWGRKDPCTRRRAVVIYNHMVVGFLEDERADRVFHALADATRRDIVVRTLEGEHSVSALARRYPMSFAAVQKHVAVLEDAGLVTKQRKGREQIVRGDVDTIRRANQLLDGLEAVWRVRVEQMGEILADDPIGGTR
jgi:DNA-binding transcriptional ArsR family regulator